MENYSYVAYTKQGKETKGQVAAETLDQARDMVKQTGATIISIEESSALNSEVSFKGLQKAPSSRDMSVFCRQFTSIVDAGVPILEALGMLTEQTENPALRDAIQGCKTRIEKGSSMADAMEQYPRVFSHIFVTMARAGEQSGSLSTSFDRMGKQFEKQHKLESLVKKASIYPTVLLVITVIVVIVLLRVVVPTFKDMLSGLGTELPAITKFTLGLSEGIGKFWPIILVVVVAIVIFIKWFKKTDKGMHVFGKMGVTLPVVKNLTIKSNAASFARTLSTLIAAGLPMLDALTITADTQKNILFTDAINEAKQHVAMGTNLAGPLRDTDAFPPLVYHMIEIGEDTGNIDGMLDRVADYYEEEVQEATEQVTALMEPLIIVILGLVVGTIIISVVSPMASMYQSLDNL